MAARPEIVQSNWQLGMRRDTSRDRLPDGASWNMVDWIPEHGAPLRKRGGWRYEGDALDSPATKVTALIFAEFAADPRLVAVDEDAKIHVGAVEGGTLQEPPAADWDDVGNFQGAWAAAVEASARYTVEGATGGTFTLTFSGQTTTALAWNISAAALQTALEALSNVAPGDVVVMNWFAPVGSVDVSVIWPFAGAHGAIDVPLMTFNSTNLTGGPIITTAQDIVTGSGKRAIDDVVTNAGTAWVALQVVKSTTPPAEGAAWHELTPWRGAWVGGGDGYDPGDYVSNGGDAFLADFTPTVFTSFAAILTRSPVFFDNLVILPDIAGAADPKTYDGVTTVANLGGSPPNGIYACVHRGRLVLANTATNPNRVFFSDPGDPASWDANNVIDCSAPVTGIASLYDRLLVWSDRRLEAITGAIPPGEPDSDMALRPMFETGCDDNRSIAVSGDKAIFSNAEGVYATDGVSLTDLTELGGYKTRWADLMVNWDELSPGGVYRGHYVVVVEGVLVVCDLGRAAFWEFTNFPATMFAHSTRIRSELYFGLSTEARVARLSTSFTGTNVDDANGTIIEPVLETPFYQGKGLGKKTQSDPRLTYMLETEAATTLDVSCVTEPHSEDYQALGSLDPSEFTRAAIEVGMPDGLGFALKIEHNGESDGAHLHAIEATLGMMESSRAS